MHTYMPANSTFDGPITNLLSVLCILVEVLSRARVKRENSLNGFKFGASVGHFSSDGAASAAVKGLKWPHALQFWTAYSGNLFKGSVAWAAELTLSLLKFVLSVMVVDDIHLIPCGQVHANDEGSDMSGYLWVAKNKKWKRLWFVVKGKVLYTYKASEVRCLNSLSLSLSLSVCLSLVHTRALSLSVSLSVCLSLS